MLVGREKSMLHHTFWTERRFTGILLILGCVLFLTAAGLMPRDAQGNYVVLLPDREALLVIAAQTSLFQWSFSLFISGIVLMPLGLAMLTRLLQDAHDRAFSSLALIASLVGAVLMVINFAFALGISPLAAQETATTGVVPNYYVPLNMAIQPLFVLATILSFSALAVYGGAVLTTHMLPRWLGWLAIVYGLAGLLFVWFAAGDVPPFLHYVLPIVIGVLLLLPRYQVPGKHEEHSLNEQ